MNVTPRQAVELLRLFCYDLRDVCGVCGLDWFHVMMIEAAMKRAVDPEGLARRIAAVLAKQG